MKSMPIASVPFTPATAHVEIVVGAERDLPRRAAFRRVGTDVVELLEAGRIFEVAEQRKAVPPDPFLRLRGIGPRRKRQPPGGEREQGGREQGSAIHEELQYGLRAASSRCRAPAISGGDYVFFNCGASMPARAATKWTSHPRGSAGSDTALTAYCAFGAGAGALGCAGAAAGGFAEALGAGLAAGAPAFFAVGSGSG